MTIGGKPPGGDWGPGRAISGPLVRVAARDEAAFRTLYRQTGEKLNGILFRILQRKDAAAEVLQEAYVRIWEKAADFDVAKGSPLAWMATIARNRALDEVRRVRPASLEDLPEGFEPAAEQSIRSPRATGQNSLLLSSPASSGSRTRSAPLSCSPTIRASREALAKRFGRPVPTIKTWLHRSLAQLRDCLSS